MKLEREIVEKVERYQSLIAKEEDLNKTLCVIREEKKSTFQEIEQYFEEKHLLKGISFPHVIRKQPEEISPKGKWTNQDEYVSVSLIPTQDGTKCTGMTFYKSVVEGKVVAVFFDYWKES